MNQINNKNEERERNEEYSSSNSNSNSLNISINSNLYLNSYSINYKVNNLKEEVKYLLERQRLLKNDIYEYEPHSYYGIEFRYIIIDICRNLLGEGDDSIDSIISPYLHKSHQIQKISFPQTTLIGNNSIDNYILNIWRIKSDITRKLIGDPPQSVNIIISVDPKDILIGESHGMLSASISFTSPLFESNLDLIEQSPFLKTTSPGIYSFNVMFYIQIASLPPIEQFSSTENQNNDVKRKRDWRSCYDFEDNYDCNRYDSINSDNENNYEENDGSKSNSSTSHLKHSSIESENFQMNHQNKHYIQQHNNQLNASLLTIECSVDISHIYESMFDKLQYLDNLLFLKQLEENEKQKLSKQMRHQKLQNLKQHFKYNS